MTGTENAAVDSPRRRLKLAWQAFATYGHRQWLRCLLLLLFGAGVHIPALRRAACSGTISIWPATIHLSRVRCWSWKRSAITSSLILIAGHYRPGPNHVSYIFDYLVWNTDDLRISSFERLFWHVGSGLLLYFLLKELFITRFGMQCARPDGRAVTPKVTAAVIDHGISFRAALDSSSGP